MRIVNTLVCSLFSKDSIELRSRTGASPSDSLPRSLNFIRLIILMEIALKLPESFLGQNLLLPFLSIFRPIFNPIAWNITLWFQPVLYILPFQPNIYNLSIGVWRIPHMIGCLFLFSMADSGLSLSCWKYSVGGRGCFIARLAVNRLIYRSVPLAEDQIVEIEVHHDSFGQLGGWPLIVLSLFIGVLH